MKMKPLGKSGIDVGPLALGGNVFGWTVDDPTSFQLLDAFVDAGLNLIDTADVYTRWIPGHQGGESETVIGKWFKKSGKRSRVVLATKVGMDMGPAGKGLSRDHIMQSVEASLKRLQTDYIDLYQSHCDDESTPLDETLAAYTELLKSGKVRAIGASNYDAKRLAAALQVSREKNFASYISLQPHYNLVARKEFESELEPLCLKEGLGVISYFALAAGFLTGKYRSEADLSKSQRAPRIQAHLNEQGFRVLAALDQVAEHHRVNQAQVALAWLMQRKSVTAPIASATNLNQMKDLVASTRLTLDAESVAKLDRASG